MVDPLSSDWKLKSYSIPVIRIHVNSGNQKYKREKKKKKIELDSDFCNYEKVIWFWGTLQYLGESKQDWLL